MHHVCFCVQTSPFYKNNGYIGLVLSQYRTCLQKITFRDNGNKDYNIISWIGGGQNSTHGRTHMMSRPRKQPAISIRMKFDNTTRYGCWTESLSSLMAQESTGRPLLTSEQQFLLNVVPQ